MSAQVNDLRNILSAKGGQPEMTVDNIDEFVFPTNPLSTKILNLQCKYSALEDAMQVAKKAYDKDEISLEDYLKVIRTLAKKQARQKVKLNKLMPDEQPGMPGGMPMMQGGLPAGGWQMPQRAF